MSADSIAHTQIRAFFERWERLEAEKDAISGDLRELFAEAKGNGFDTKVLRKLFRDQVADAGERNEFEALYDLYAAALNGPRVRDARDAREDEPEHDADGVIIEREAGVRPAASGESPVTPSAAAAQAANANAGGQNVESSPAHAPEQPGHDNGSVNLPAEGSANSDAISAPATNSTAEVPDRSSETDPLAAPVRPSHNPDTHFLNSKNLARLHGCQDPEDCAGSRSKLCYGCSTKDGRPEFDMEASAP